MRYFTATPSVACLVGTNEVGEACCNATHEICGGRLEHCAVSARLRGGMMMICFLVGRYVLHCFGLVWLRHDPSALGCCGQRWLTCVEFGGVLYSGKTGRKLSMSNIRG